MTSSTPPRPDERGIALIMVVLATTFLSALGIGLMMAVFMDRLATGNLNGSIALLYATDAAIELSARELARAADWDRILSGSERSGLTDGAPSGIRALAGGGTVDLTAATNWLNCGKATTCTAAQMNASSRERPWGLNNPRWQLFAYGPIEQFIDAARPALCYLAVWIADDGREVDGNPLADASEGVRPGHGIVRIHAEAYGSGSARRAIEAELSRICRDPAREDCLPGIRVQSWQELRQAVP